MDGKNMKDFQDKSFDVVIDKAFIDCLYVNVLRSVPITPTRMFKPA